MQGEEAISRRRERIEFVRKVVARYERPLNNIPIEYRKTSERRSVSLDPKHQRGGRFPL